MRISGSDDSLFPQPPADGIISIVTRLFEKGRQIPLSGISLKTECHDLLFALAFSAFSLHYYMTLTLVACAQGRPTSRQPPMPDQPLSHFASPSVVADKRRHSNPIERDQEFRRSRSEVPEWLTQMHQSLWNKPDLRSQVFRTTTVTYPQFMELEKRLNENNPSRQTPEYQCRDTLQIKLNILNEIFPHQCRKIMPQ